MHDPASFWRRRHRCRLGADTEECHLTPLSAVLASRPRAVTNGRHLAALQPPSVVEYMDAGLGASGECAEPTRRRACAAPFGCGAQVRGARPRRLCRLWRQPQSHRLVVCISSFRLPVEKMRCGVWHPEGRTAVPAPDEENTKDQQRAAARPFVAWVESAAGQRSRCLGARSRRHHYQSLQPPPP